MDGARNASASTPAAEAGISGATIRSRIHEFEDSGIVHGSTAQVDFELVGRKLTNLYLYDVPVTEREMLAHEARAIPGIINVRTLMTGRRNLHILAVGEGTGDLWHVVRLLTDIGIHIEDENLLEKELLTPCDPLDPDNNGHAPKINDFINLTGGANVVEVPVQSDALIVGLTLGGISERGILDDETLVIAIEQGDRELTPHGGTVIEPDDIVTVLSRVSGDADMNALLAFHNSQTESSPG